MRTAGTYALLGGLVSFLGWAFNVRRLTDWSDSGISIQPNAAVCVTLAGMALILITVERRKFAAALGLIIALIGGATLFEIVSGVSLRFHSLLMFGREWGRAGVLTP